MSPESTNPTPPSDPADIERLTRRVLKVCDAAGAFIEYWGFKSLHGRVWTLLALNNTPTSQARLAATLGVSRASISLVVSDLLGYGLVRPIGTHRNAPYEAIIDVWPVISDVLRDREWMILEAARIALEAAIEEAEYQGGGGPYNVERMRLLLGMTEFAQVFLSALIALRMPQTVKQLRGWLSKVKVLTQRFVRAGL